MSTDLFFEHFATLATAPEGIPRLRELILQLAVQGKLGTQEPGDEPASVLLERIKKERQHLISKGTIKKAKSLDPIRTDELSYQIPATWVISRLGEIAQYNAEIKVSAKDVADDAWILDLEDIEKDTSRILQKLRNKDRQSLSSKSRFLKGDILYGKLRPYLNKVVVADEDGYCTTEIVPIRPYGKIFPNYLMYALKTPDFLAYVNSKTYGIKMPRLGTTDALNTIIPLPPLAEQHRIVEKVDRLMALCDELEAKQQQERAGCLRLGTASLTALHNADNLEEFERQWAQVCEAFELIFDCPENVTTLRQTILQLAIYGKFNTQNANDNRSEINRKNNKDLNTRSLGIFKLIDLPKKWIWTKLGYIAEVGQGGTPSTNFPEYWNGSVPWLRSGDIKFNRITKANETISELGLKNSAATMCPVGTVMLAMTGQGVTRGRAAILDIEASANQSCAHIILNINLMIPEFLFYFFRAEYWNIRTLDKGTGQPGLNTKIIKLFDIPLPPLAEQHRIVARVDALMALCDELEARLKERAAVQGRFAAAVGKMVAGE